MIMRFRNERPERIGMIHARGQILGHEVVVAPIAIGPACRFGERAGQRTLVERHTGDHADVQLLAEREQLVLWRLVKDVIDHLDGIDVAGAQGFERVPRLPAIDADANAADRPSLLRSAIVRCYRSSRAWASPQT